MALENLNDNVRFGLEVCKRDKKITFFLKVSHVYNEALIFKFQNWPSNDEKPIIFDIKQKFVAVRNFQDHFWDRKDDNLCLIKSELFKFKDYKKIENGFKNYHASESDIDKILSFAKQIILKHCKNICTFILRI